MKLGGALEGKVAALAERVTALEAQVTALGQPPPPTSGSEPVEPGPGVIPPFDADHWTSKDMAVTVEAVADKLR